MKYEEYQEIYREALLLDEDFQHVVIPIKPLPGEQRGETLLRFLIESELIKIDGDYFCVPDRDKVEAFDPNLLKMLDAMLMSTARAELDELEEMGLVYTSVDDDGNIIYVVTEAGEDYWNQQSQD